MTSNIFGRGFDSRRLHQIISRKSVGFRSKARSDQQPSLTVRSEFFSHPFRKTREMHGAPFTESGYTFAAWNEGVIRPLTLSCPPRNILDSIHECVSLCWRQEVLNGERIASILSGASAVGRCPEAHTLQARAPGCLRRERLTVLQPLARVGKVVSLNAPIRCRSAKRWQCCVCII